jgi:hypothetical protein
MRMIFALLAGALLSVPRLMAITGYDLVSEYYQPELSWWALAVIAAMLLLAYPLFAMKLLHNSKALVRYALRIAVVLFIVCVAIPLLLNQGWSIPTLLVDIINVARGGAYLAFFAACALVLVRTYFTLEAALATGGESPVEPPARPTDQKSAAASPIRNWIDDVPPYPWDLPIAQRLKDRLVATFDEPDRIRQLTRSADAPDSSKIAFSKAPDKIWVDVLDLAAREGSLRTLLRYIADKERVAPTLVSFIEELLNA